MISDYYKIVFNIYDILSSKGYKVDLIEILNILLSDSNINEDIKVENIDIIENGDKLNNIEFNINTNTIKVEMIEHKIDINIELDKDIPHDILVKLYNKINDIFNLYYDYLIYSKDILISIIKDRIDNCTDEEILNFDIIHHPILIYDNYKYIKDALENNDINDRFIYNKNELTKDKRFYICVYKNKLKDKDLYTILTDNL